MKKGTLKDKFILFLQLNDRAKKEESAYARLLFQENILSNCLIATLHSIEFFFNVKTTKYILTDERKLKMENIVKITFENKKLEDKPLGQLCAIIDPFLTNNQGLKSLLKQFVSMRNNITHNMLSKYQNMEQLENDSKKVIKIGDDTIKTLNAFRYKILEEDQ